MTNKKPTYPRCSFGKIVINSVSIILCLQLIAFLSLKTSAQVAIPFWKLRPEIYSEKDIINYQSVVDKTLFISTRRGLALVNPSGASYLSNVTGTYQGFMFEVGGKLFYKTSDGAWLVNPEGRAELLKGMEGDLYGADTFNGNRVFCWTQKGPYVVDLAGNISPVRTIDGDVTSTLNVQGRLFVLATKGLYLFDGSPEPLKIEDIKGNIAPFLTFDDKVIVKAFISEIEGQFWLVDSKGAAKRLYDTEDELIGYSNNAIEIEGRLFLNTSKKLVQLDQSYNPHIVERINGDIIGTQKFGNQIFIQTSEWAWLVDTDGKTTPISGISGPVFQIEATGDYLFAGTEQGLFIVDHDGQSKRVPEIKCNVGFLKRLEGRLFVGTSCDGIRVLNDTGEIITHFWASLGNIFDVFSWSGNIFLVSEKGLFRLDPNVRIKTKLVPKNLWGALISFVLPSNWLPTDDVRADAAYYDESGENPYSEVNPANFKFASGNGAGLPSVDKFLYRDQFLYNVNLGNTDAQYWVKDEWENAFPERGAYYGVPSQYSIAVLPFVVSAFSILFSFVLAPRSAFCHAAIMNPWLRRYFSLGSIPLLLSVFPSLRRYILRRYINAINQDKEYTEWKDRFIYPEDDFLPNRFGKKIADERKLLLLGPSGIGKTSFFKYLVTSYATKEGPPSPGNVCPVYISLTNFGINSSLEELVYTQLFAYGRITDKELAPMFLEDGGLLIFSMESMKFRMLQTGRNLPSLLRDFGRQTIFV
jgi:hypothetical protein